MTLGNPGAEDIRLWSGIDRGISSGMIPAVSPLVEFVDICKINYIDRGKSLWWNVHMRDVWWQVEGVSQDMWSDHSGLAGFSSFVAVVNSHLGPITSSRLSETAAPEL
jgi:hypothetical protein